jgi:hypothetical protein
LLAEYLVSALAVAKLAGLSRNNPARKITHLHAYM